MSGVDFIRRRIKVAAVSVLVLGVAVFISVPSLFAYVPTLRETHPPPPNLIPTEVSTEGFLLLYETESLQFYLTKRGNITILDKRGVTPFMWKTGLDIPFNSEVDALVNTVPLEERYTFSREERLSDVHAAFANSLILIEYFDIRANNIVTFGNASLRGVESIFNAVEGDPSHYVLTVNLTEIDIGLELHIRFSETGMEFHVPRSGIHGEDAYRLAAVVIAPYMGAGGGARMFYNPETQSFDIRVPNRMPPAYALLPDGSGALARFNVNTMELTQYRRNVYGFDVSQDFNNENFVGFTVPPFNPLMPVYGLAYGNDEFAFFAHATSGAEYMEVIFRPAHNLTLYNCIFPRFEYNRVYFQAFNLMGGAYLTSGYQTFLDPPNRFDLTLNIEFLAGSGDTGFAANYVGMARYYREYLLSKGLLTPPRIPQSGDIPLHMDILMSDVRSSLTGLSNIVVTDVNGIEYILDSVKGMGINNISASLMGFKRNGLTAGRLDRNRFSSAVGSRRAFEDLVNRYGTKGVDISFAQDYANINRYNASYSNHAVRHAGGLYIENHLDQMSAWATNMPVESTALMRFDRASEILRSFASAMNFMDSTTVSGITNQLYSQYNRNATYTVTENIEIITDAFRYVHALKRINADAPNQYLWAYTDRFLNTPMFSSQFLVTTDTVPFLQMVLYGTMDMFSPHVNFSFYTDADILRMIDFNVYPAFLFTKEPSFLLAQTNSSHFFSTEFSQYEELINRVYTRVNGILRYTAGADWLNREVVQPGVIVNTYSNGVKVIINYTAQAVEVFGIKVDAVSAGRV
jgi:hypothetical protein